MDAASLTLRVCDVGVAPEICTVNTVSSVQLLRKQQRHTQQKTSTPTNANPANQSNGSWPIVLSIYVELSCHYFVQRRIGLLAYKLLKVILGLLISQASPAAAGARACLRSPSLEAYTVFC